MPNQNDRNLERPGNPSSSSSSTGSRDRLRERFRAARQPQSLDAIVLQDPQPRRQMQDISASSSAGDHPLHPSGQPHDLTPYSAEGTQLSHPYQVTAEVQQKLGAWKAIEAEYSPSFANEICQTFENTRAWNAFYQKHGQETSNEALYAYEFNKNNQENDIEDDIERFESKHGIDVAYAAIDAVRSFKTANTLENKIGAEQIKAYQGLYSVFVTHEAFKETFGPKRTEESYHAFSSRNAWDAFERTYDAQFVRDAYPAYLHRKAWEDFRGKYGQDYAELARRARNNNDIVWNGFKSVNSPELVAEVEKASQSLMGYEAFKAKYDHNNVEQSYHAFSSRDAWDAFERKYIPPFARDAYPAYLHRKAWEAFQGKYGEAAFDMAHRARTNEEWKNAAQYLLNPERVAEIEKASRALTKYEAFQAKYNNPDEVESAYRAYESRATWDTFEKEHDSQFVRDAYPAYLHRKTWEAFQGKYGEAAFDMAHRARTKGETWDALKLASSPEFVAEIEKASRALTKYEAFQAKYNNPDEVESAHRAYESRAAWDTFERKHAPFVSFAYSDYCIRQYRLSLAVQSGRSNDI